MTEFPLKQKALIYEAYNGPLEIKEISVPDPKNDEVLIRICYSGICHSDLHGWQGDWAEYCKLPIIGGHEGAGEVVKVGSNVQDWKVGDRAGVKIFNNNCLVCDYCKTGDDAVCEKNSNHGFYCDGTFQEYIAIRAIDAIRIPKHTDLAAAAPVLCAGVTAYRAIKESSVRPGQIIVITGAGGGLGSFALQYAKAMGLRIVAVDHSSKEEHCRNLGAEWFVDGFKQDDVVSNIVQLTNGGSHAAINFAVNKKSMELALLYVRKRGTVVFVGLPSDSNISINAQLVVHKAIIIKGSLLGSRNDCDEALDFVTRGIVNVPYKIVALTQVVDVFKQFMEGSIQSRCVVDMSL